MEFLINKCVFKRSQSPYSNIQYWFYINVTLQIYIYIYTHICIYTFKTGYFEKNFFKTVELTTINLLPPNIFTLS